MAPTPRAIRNVPYMGVIQVVAEATKLGFTGDDPDWCNLGQGQPEVGLLAGAPPRVELMKLSSIDHAYGPVGGTPALRQAVADHYNRLYRSGHRSQYTAANVAISAGGRLAISRLLAVLASGRVGYQTPDYTAYEDMLSYHAHRFVPVHIATTAEEAFRISPSRLTRIIVAHHLDALLISNPCNPTGQVIGGLELQQYLEIARATGCSLLLDEFYSHYIYRENGEPADAPVSAAAFVHDVERDPVIIVDGLTKNFRYPGWRVGWVLGPADVVDQVSRAASAIDGGPPTMIQHAALEVLSPTRADQESRVVRAVFARKRALTLGALRLMGVKVPHAPLGTFYVWGDVSALPAPYDDADELFRAALRRRVLVVPGRFFDVNPGRKRPDDAAYRQWVRFSFGPPEENVRLGLSRLGQLVGVSV